MTPEQEERERQEEQVARALAETARHDPVPPLPDAVVSRLDGVLADLVAERAAAGSARTAVGASVSGLAARRRRRRPDLLVAAAAIALIAAAGGAVATGGFGTTSSSNDSTSSTAGGSTAEDRAPAAAAPESAPDSGTSDSSAARAAIPRLRTSSLARDVRRVLDDQRTDLPGPGPRRKALSGPPLPSNGCPAPSTRPGDRLLVVRLDGRPATLLLGPVRGDTRSAAVYRCGATSPAAIATVSLR